MITNATRRRAQTGFGYDRRTYNRAYPFSLSSVNPPAQNGNLEISTVTGALLGSIRLDKQRSEIHAFQFSKFRGNCTEGELQLLRPPKFALEPFSILRFVIDGESKWCGSVTAPSDAGTDYAPLKYKLYGLTRWISNFQLADGYTVFPATTDVTEIVRSIVQFSLAPRSPVRYNEAKIGPLAGVVIAEELQAQTFTAKKILDWLEKLATTPDYFYRWGVDGEGDFFWKRIDRNFYEKHLHVGYHLQSFSPEQNYEAVKNAVQVHREQADGTGEAGWGVIFTGNDLSSQKKYGLSELIEKVPGWIDLDDAENFGQRLLDTLSEPGDSAGAAQYFPRKASDYFEPGMHRITMPLAEFRTVANDLDADDAEDFVYDEYGGLSVSSDTENYVYGNGSVLFEWITAAGEVAEIDLAELIGKVQRVSFYARSNRGGVLVSVGVGKDAWNEYETKIAFPNESSFQAIELDLSQYNLRDVRKFGIRVESDSPDGDTPTRVWLDKLEFVLFGNKTYEMELTEEVYSFQPEGIECKTKWGTPSFYLSDYVSGLRELVETLRGSGGVR